MLHVFSINNQVVSLNEREQYVLNKKDKARLYKQLSEQAATQIVILSTCQRFEVYTEMRRGVQEKIKQVLIDFFDLTPVIFHRQFIEHSGDQALIHLLKVSTGLLAHVLGETQVLGQVKIAYEEAVTHQTVSKSFHTIFQSTFHFSKQMHKQTGINDHPVSLSYSAYQFIETKVSAPKTILILGAGNMGQLFIEYALPSQHRLIVLNRDQTKLIGLPETVTIGKLSDWPHYIESADVVVSSLELDSPLMTRTSLQLCQVENLLMIDLALPRSIEPSVQTLSGIELFDLDQLGETIDAHYFVRKQKAQIIIDCMTQEVSRLNSKLHSQQFDEERRTLFLERDQLLTEAMAGIDRQLPALSKKERTVIQHHLKQAVTKATLLKIEDLKGKQSNHHTFNTKERTHD
ncbi:glutamyl-tRNA reductase [Halolactibacillus miurensis]|uniref:Glutamyl-tRNA reductase n=1 Tax=Halolactibacillus miurensis TaxID=306541 RepID=A0A1I6PIL4_9BACI|nr:MULTISPECIES: glutamyl-tRNA reductase [Halolactibacillus]GEM03825.1 glutamyl-tRNA reductase [Halolactibacillus miurensis]SFS40016.1 glutamyl-tRNA reductase [Halolactibacillus miurensis]